MTKRQIRNFMEPINLGGLPSALRTAFSMAILLCAQIQVSLGQNHDYLWFYGSYGGANPPPASSSYGRAVVDFSKVPAVSYKSQDIKINFDGTSSVCSDSMGALLYYSNGISIRAKNHALMQNGDTLNPGQLWNASVADGYTNVIPSFSLPFPGHPNQYYYFHCGWLIDQDSFYIRNNPFYYTIVDMNANGGMGKVVKKNQIILEGDLGCPAACKHGNGRDWWITIHDLSDAEQLTYLLSPDGLTGPFIQQIGPSFSPLSPEFASKSIFSPDGRTYVRNDGNNGPRIMDFDRCSGIFSNMRIIPFSNGIYTWSAAISPNNRFLYMSNPRRVFYVDLNSPNLGNSFDTLSLFNGTACPALPNIANILSMQEAPDGKIYANGVSDNRCMSRIEQPNLPILASDMAWGGFSLPRQNYSTICHFPHYRLGELAGSPCDTLNFQQPGNGFYRPPYDLSTYSRRLETKDDYQIFEMPFHIVSESDRLEKIQNGNILRLNYINYQKALGRLKAVEEEPVKLKNHHE